MTDRHRLERQRRRRRAEPDRRHDPGVQPLGLASPRDGESSKSAVVPPVTPGRPANFWKEGVYNRDFDAGYYPKGDCLCDQDGNGCVILYLFGGFGNRLGKVMRQLIQFSPVRSSVDYTRNKAGH
jgi:hypothetical protein